MKNNQEQEEIQVFNQFALTCPYFVNAGSIKNRKPPEPDIYCTVRGGSSVCFESCEIVDKEYARTLSGSEHIRRAIQRKVDELSDEDKMKLDQNFSETDISFKFSAKKSQNSILKSIGPVVNYLLVLPQQEGLFVLNKESFRHHVSQNDFLSSAVKQDGILGEQLLRGMKMQGGGTVYLKPDKNLEKVLEHVQIRKGMPHGPIFNVLPCGVWSTIDLALERIDDKFNKKYDTHYDRIELLCYYARQPELSDDLWLPNVRKFVETNINSSPFQRVWIYSAITNKVVYVYPTLS